MIAPSEVNRLLKPLNDRIAAIKATQPKELTRAYIWNETGPKAPVTYVLKRGDPTRPGAAVEPGVPAVLAGISHTASPHRQDDRAQALAGPLADQAR